MSHPLALPKNFSPDALDTSTELASILARLRPPQAEGSSAGLTPGAAAPGTGGAGATSSATPATEAGGGASLHLRDLPTATDNLKHKLHHAREQVKLLPDVSRTLAEQESEIALLEERVKQQQAVLARLRADGVQFATDKQQRDADKMQA